MIRILIALIFSLSFLHCNSLEMNQEECPKVANCGKKSIVLTNEYLRQNGFDEHSETIDLKYKCIKSIKKDAFEGFENVKTLDLSFNNIVYVEIGTFDPLSQAETIRLNNNYIVDMEGALINKILQLKEFKISCNKMTVLTQIKFVHQAFLFRQVVGFLEAVDSPKHIVIN